MADYASQKAKMLELADCTLWQIAEMVVDLEGEVSERDEKIGDLEARCEALADELKEAS